MGYNDVPLAPAVQAAAALAERAHRAGLVLTPEEQRLTGLHNRVAKPGSAYYRPDGWTAAGALTKTKEPR